MLASGPAPRRYDGGAQLLHWVISPLVLVQFCLVWWAATLPRGPLMGTVFAWHKSIGVTLLVLVVIRLLWRLTHRVPPLPHAIPIWQRAAAHVSHYALYILLLAQPLAGLLLTLAGKRPLVLFGGLVVPSPTGPNEALHKFGEAAHFWIGYALLALAVLHVAAALYHHFGRRDTVLLRMLPGRRAALAQERREAALT